MLVRKFHVALLLLICSLLAIGAFAQNATTGAIEGTVKTGGTPLPGVTIEVRSPNLQGVRTGVTDAGGNFRFTLLPQGIYTVTANLQGFNRINQPNVAVEINRTKTLDITMNAATSETITVTGAAPVVDVTSAQSGVNVSSQTLQALPIARNFTAAAQIAPGTATQTGNGQGANQTTVYGSSGSENEYIVDGLNRLGWDVARPKAGMFVWAPIPEPWRSRLGSIDFAMKLLEEAEVAVSPGRGFGEAGEGHLRLALIENEQRLRQAVRQIGRCLKMENAVS